MSATEWRLDVSDLTFLAKLGSGTSGKVFKGFLPSPQTNQRSIMHYLVFAHLSGDILNYSILLLLKQCVPWPPQAATEVMKLPSSC